MKHTDFEPDPSSSNQKPTARLAQLLSMQWKDLKIIRIDRVTQGSQAGWLVTFEK